MASRTPGADRTNEVTTVDPTINDDETGAYDVGSRWINTANGRVFFCVDTTTGAAVWKDVTATAGGSHPVTVDTSDPTVTDDSNAGFAVGDHWINSTTLVIWQLADDANGSAVWKRVDQPKVEIATADPTVGDDNLDDFEIGSLWINTDTPEVFMATDVSTGAAIWVSLSEDQGDQIGREEPGVVTPGGTLYLYGNSGGFSANEVQYARVFLRKGATYGSMRMYLDRTTGAAKDIRMGLYDQADPSDETDVPDSRLRQTDLFNATEDVFTEEAFNAGSGGNYEVTVTGYYWLAIVRGGGGGQFQVQQTADSYPADFLPVRRQSTTGTALPATASGLTNPASAVVLCSMLEA